MLGDTNPLQLMAGSIRGNMGISIQKNLMHASDSEESA